MSAYWVSRVRVANPTEFKKYAELAPAIIASHGGKLLARAGRSQILEGPDKFDRFVVIEFPTFEDGVACFNSREYQAAATFRRNGAAEVEAVVVEGLPSVS